MIKLYKEPDEYQWNIIVKSRNIIYNKSKQYFSKLDAFTKRNSTMLFEDFDDSVFLNTFKLDVIDFHESIKKMDMLQSHFKKMYLNCRATDVYVASKFHPYFILTNADAITNTLNVSRPVLIKKEVFDRELTDIVPLIAHEFTHSILHTKDYYLEDDSNLVNDAYAYEQIYRYFSDEDMK